MRFLTLIVAAAALTGCATHADYYAAIADTNARIVAAESARANADVARYQALAEIAKGGDPASRAVAAMALAMGGQSRPQLAVPQPQQSEALQWASVLSGPVTMGISSYFGAQIQMNASDNARATAVSTNAAFAGLGAAISTAGTAGYPFVQAPVVAAPVVPPSNVTTTTTTTNTTTTTDSSTHSSVGDYSGASSGNGGQMIGGDYSDSTHQPTVVTQPGPVVVSPLDFLVTVP